MSLQDLIGKSYVPELEFSSDVLLVKYLIALLPFRFWPMLFLVYGATVKWEMNEPTE